MDQLPKEIISEIKYFYQTTEIDIMYEKVFGREKCIFIFRCQSMITKIPVSIWQGYDKENIHILDEFVIKLSSNENCKYTRDWPSYGCFSIEIADNTIIFNFDKTVVCLTIDSKNQLISIMKQFRDILNKK